MGDLIYPKNAQKADVTPYIEYYDTVTNRMKKSNYQTSDGTIILPYITVPKVEPGLYYIEVTGTNIDGSKSGAMLFRVTGVPTRPTVVPTSISPSPAASPTPIPTAIPTIMPVSVSVDRNETKSRNVHTFYSTAHDIYHGPNQICAEDL